MENVLIGHCNNDYTGVSVVIFPGGAVAGVDVRGSAPGTRETDLLKCGNLVKKINAITLSGGSAFGLDAASGVMRFLHEKGWGFNTGKHIVPIVSAAVLFDLYDGKLHYPDSEMGYTACKNAKENNNQCGRVGAGKGATVGKILGLFNSSWGGVGVASVKIGQAEVGAIVAVNAFGDIFDCHNGRILAGAKLSLGEFLDTTNYMLNHDLSMYENNMGFNTTIGVVYTDAALDKEQVNKMASIAHDGLALSIRPVHTMLDGDTMFAASVGDKHAEFNSLCVGATEAVRLAVINAVKPQIK
ncbi:MAG TPA: P1 family peptidase [Clostridiales bacterium]|nr:P1 family peptidase [Clostridiales bacterium]